MSDRLQAFLVAVANNPTRAQRFATDAKALADELHRSDLNADEKDAILSRDSARIRTMLGGGGVMIIQILDFFRGGSKD